MQNLKKSNNKKLIAAAIIEKDGKILIAQRSDAALVGKWEFPGGKVEGNETLEQCLTKWRKTISVFILELFFIKLKY